MFKHTFSMILFFLTSTFVFGGSREDPQAPDDSFDLLLAALGTAVLECQGKVEPTTFSTASGFLVREFTECKNPDASIDHVDGLLAMQHSREGQADNIAGYYVAAWDGFTREFPFRKIRGCPDWTLVSVIDAPTAESVRRYARLQPPGKENRRYKVTSEQCGRDIKCTIAHAKRCVAAFGESFVVSTNVAQGTVETDPVWWLTDYEYSRADPACNPFSEATLGLCFELESNPFASYAAIERAGDSCCAWSEPNQKIYFGAYQPIDCGGGYMCASYCKP